MFLKNLFTGVSVAHDVVILAAVVVLGFSLGRIQARGIRLGIAGILFSGIFFGHFGFTVSPPILHFVKEFGLILFVYSIGMQVGPGFFASLKKQGLRLNVLAAGIVFVVVLVTVGLIFVARIPVPAAVGLLSGGTTNTPSLGAAQEALKAMVPPGDPLQQFPGMAYAMAYPFGILGIILNIILLRTFFKIDPAGEGEQYQRENAQSGSNLRSLNIEVDNENLDGVPIEDIPVLRSSGVVVSRVMHGGMITVARPDTVLHLHDTIHAVGTPDKLKELRMMVGSVSAIDLKGDIASNITARRIILSRKAMVGKTVDEFCLSGFSDVTVTRISRAGIELTASPGMTLQYGDEILMVGSEEALKKASEVLGDSARQLGMPLLQPYFLGILLGVVVGSIPLSLPGLPVPVKLGLAGGPLLVALCLSRIGHIGRFIFYIPEGANHMMREFGITLFLACVGISSGGHFVETLMKGDGFYWMACATLITFVPLFVVGIFARKVLKLNYLTICGVLSGSMTDPPALAFANSLTKSSATSVAYATVYPLVMILRVVAAQLLIIIFMS